jgi:hypothetical protein
MAWTGSNPLPDILALCRASVVRHNGADFKIIVVTPENLREYVDPHPAYEYLSLVHRADYLRLYLLHQYGGIYLDMDTIALRSLKQTYADLSRYDLVTYDGAIWGEVFGISVFGPTRRDSNLTQAWDKAVRDHLDRRHDELAAHRSQEANPRSDCLGWSELLSALVQPIARQLASEGQLSIRLLEPTWAHFAAGGPARDELFVAGSPTPPDTELLILNHAMLTDEFRQMSTSEILRSELGLCSLLQHALGRHPSADVRSPSALTTGPRPATRAVSSIAVSNGNGEGTSGNAERLIYDEAPWFAPCLAAYEALERQLGEMRDQRDHWKRMAKRHKKAAIELRGILIDQKNKRKKKRKKKQRKAKD